MPDPTPTAGLQCHSLYRPDKNPSAGINVGDGPQRGLYVDFGENGRGGKIWLARGIFDVIADVGSFYVTGRDAYFGLGRKVGVIEATDKRAPKPPPTLDEVKRFQKNLTPEIRQFLQDKRGLSEASIAKFRVGWAPKRERQRLPGVRPDPGRPASGEYPVPQFQKAAQNLKPVRITEKPGCGGWTAWPPAPQGSTVIITEGEFDCMLAEQETGCIGVSSTNGVKAFKPEWTNHFHGRHVVVMYDCDQEGREGVQNLILPAFKEAVNGGPGVVPQGGLAL